MSVKPIIVSGIGRSGTSAVLSSLSTHKSIVDIPRIGEAPFISAFLKFLVDFEDKSSAAEYNRKNYRLKDNERSEVISEFLIRMQCDIDSSSIQDKDNRFWITKTSLGREEFDKAVSLFGEIRCVYVMRNGIEVVNSARKFVGFKDLTFEQQCNRWLENLKQCEYLNSKPLCCTVKHDELVKNPDNVFKDVYAALELSYDETPGKWISENLFNSSFDSSSKNVATNNIFDNRLSNAWSDWSDEEKYQFIELCDSTMCEYGFSRPYENNQSSISPLNSSEFSSKKIPLTNTTKTVNRDSYSTAALDVCDGKMRKQILNYICNVSSKYKYLYVNNNKVASTSILKMLQHCEDSEAAELMSNPHERGKSPLGKLTSLSHEKQNQYLFGDDIKRFSFVRNPYARILSAYLSKIVRPLEGYKFNPDRPSAVPPKGQIIRLFTGQPINESTEFNMNIDFKTFVELVSEQSTYEMDPHWKPQYDLLMADKIEYSFIGRFEEMSSEIETLMNLIKITNYDSPGYSDNRTNSVSQLREYYTDETIKLVAEKFKIDFDHYVYSTDFELLLPVAA